MDGNREPEDGFSDSMINFSFGYMAAFLTLVVVALGLVEMKTDMADILMLFGFLAAMAAVFFLVQRFEKRT